MTFWDFLYKVLPTRDSLVYVGGMALSAAMFLANDLKLVHELFDTTPQQEQWIMRAAFALGIAAAKLHHSPAGLSDKGRQKYIGDTVRLTQ